MVLPRRADLFGPSVVEQFERAVIELTIGDQPSISAIGIREARRWTGRPALQSFLT